MSVLRRHSELGDFSCNPCIYGLGEVCIMMPAAYDAPINTSYEQYPGGRGIVLSRLLHLLCGTLLKLY